MPVYYFNLVGDFDAHDVAGHECADDQEARHDGDMIAHRLATEKPSLARATNYVSVRNERDEEIYRAPLRHAEDGTDSAF